MADFLTTPKVQFLDNSGDPLSGGKVYVYEPGTTTAKNSYPTIADAQAGTNPNTNPVILDSRGEAVIILDGNSKIQVDDSSDSNIYTVDNVNLNAGGNNQLSSIVDSNNNELIVFSEVASAVNYLDISNAATGNGIILASAGDDSNVDVNINAKGSGDIHMDSTLNIAGSLVATSNGTFLNSLNFSDAGRLGYIRTATSDIACGFETASGDDDYIVIDSGQTGTNPTFKTAGADTNINIEFDLKGTGGVYFNCNLVDSNSNEILVFNENASAVNHLQVSNAATGNAVDLSAVGDDTNIGVDVTAKGTGVIKLDATSGIEPTGPIVDSSGNTLAEFSNSGTATGWLDFECGNNEGRIQAAGAGANSDVHLLAKGSGQIKFANSLITFNGFTIYDSNSQEQVVFTETGSAVNHVGITNAATGNAPAIDAIGDDTNIDLDLGAKGSGMVSLQSDLDVNGNDIHTSSGTIDLWGQNSTRVATFSDRSSGTGYMSLQGGTSSINTQMYFFGADVEIGSGTPEANPGGFVKFSSMIVPGSGSEFTISTGQMSEPYNSWHTVDTESDAASDDLDTIVATNVETGALLFLSAANSARTVVVKNGTGNIQLAGATDFSMDHADDRILLMYDGTNWVECFRANNS